MSVELEDGAMLRNPDFKIEEWSGKVLVCFDGPKRPRSWHIQRIISCVFEELDDIPRDEEGEGDE